MITQKQSTLTDFLGDFQEIFENNKSQFLSLLENHIDSDSIIPLSSRQHYYASTFPTIKSIKIRQYIDIALFHIFILCI